MQQVHKSLDGGQAQPKLEHSEAKKGESHDSPQLPPDTSFLCNIHTQSSIGPVHHSPQVLHDLDLKKVESTD